ncbi:MAG: EI24 domain-containing protein [Pseudomonadota bacterium]
MDLIKGLQYNFRGLLFGIKSGKLLFWGCVRFLFVIIIMFLFTGLVLAYHNEILNLIWAKPESAWILWLWHVVSWLVTLFLLAVSAVFSYLTSQILFSVVIMDLMSRITEVKVRGRVSEPRKPPFFKLFIYLVRQEIPRTTIPVMIALFIMILSWFIALGPILVPISSLVAIIFLSWDNTDLLPARRMIPFRQRWGFMAKNLLFHIGFGLPFLIPGINVLFLSFAPVGATLYALDKADVPGKAPI